MRYFAVFILILATSANAASKMEGIELICGAAEYDAADALALYSRIDNPNLRDKTEVSRTVYAELVKRDRIKNLEFLEQQKKQKKYNQKFADEFLPLMTTSRNGTYKFALCERMKRPNALTTTISTEAYQRCVELIAGRRNDSDAICF
jgi:hypothetical protein